jgi:hypothetical protein
MQLTHKTMDKAVKRARKLAEEGPRVSAVLTDGDLYGAVPGYLDADTNKCRQVALVTPDGRVWETKDTKQ